MSRVEAETRTPLEFLLGKVMENSFTIEYRGRRESDQGKNYELVQEQILKSHFSHRYLSRQANFRSHRKLRKLMYVIK